MVALNYYKKSEVALLDATLRRVLKEKFPHREDVLTEIINLEAILHLPKGTEHFVSDLHGEFEAFDHVLRNGSGSVKEKLRECFPNMPPAEMEELAVLIYYPEEKLKVQGDSLSVVEMYQWYHGVIPMLLRTTNYCGKKYSRSKVRKALPSRFAYIMEELLTEVDTPDDKKDYFEAIVAKIIQLGQADELVVALSQVIRRLVIDHLHVVGDIYDRGPAPDKIMDRLMALPSVDIQWGNHDLVWLAIACGSKAAMMNAIRISARYGNLDLLEDSYGINLRPLIEFVQKYYQPVPAFAPHLLSSNDLLQAEQDLLNQLQQGAAILQFKLESQLIARRPEFGLASRDVLQMIDYPAETILLAGKTYPLTDFNAVTIDPQEPAGLTAEEESLLEKLMAAFDRSERFQKHMEFLVKRGSMYDVYNGNLLYHGCIPLHDNGDFKSLRIDGVSYSGKALLDFFETQVRAAYETPQLQQDFATDMLWYLWIGENSSLFGKKAMATFERYYITDKATHKEEKNAYYRLRNEEAICTQIMAEFGLTGGCIINGHTPVKEKDGEDPIKANGRLVVIDGGFAKSYQKTTGLAGYTLLYNSYGIQLVAHQPFSSVEDAVVNKTDILSVKRLVERLDARQQVKDTNVGKKLMAEMQMLETLYNQY